jgi:hypothetical protein
MVEVLHLAATFMLWASAGCAAPHTTHLSSAVWRRCFADACGHGSWPEFHSPLSVRCPSTSFRVKTGMWRSRCVPIICVPIVGALFFFYFDIASFYFDIASENEAERRLGLDKQIAVCFQNGQTRFRSSFPTPLQKTSPTFRALSKAAPCTFETYLHSDEIVITVL